MLRPTPRLLLVTVLGCPIAALPAIAGPGLWPVWIATVAACALAAGLDVVLTARGRDVRCAVDAPPVLFPGVEAEMTVQVTAPPRTRRVEVAPGCGGVLAGAGRRVARLVAGAWSGAFPLRAARRGRANVHGVALRWTGPFGLVYRERTWPIAREIDVVPDTRAVRAAALRMRARPEQQAGLKVEQYLGDGSEFEALRDFVPGLDRRAVDWKASARHRELLCRQYRAERNHAVILAVDCGNRMGEEIDGTARVDHAIHAALQLACACLRAGDLVGVFAFDDRPRVHRRPEAGLQAMAGIQRALAAVDYSTAETNYTLALTALLTDVRRRSLVVLFSDFQDSITAELMVPNVLHLARRHLVVFVVLRDPLLARAAAAPPAGITDVHRAVVAAEFLRDRGIVLERIRRAGVHVVEASAAEVGPALVGRYLDVLRRELV